MSIEKIVDIDITMQQSNFEQELEDFIQNWPESMSYKVEVLRTRMGKSMYKVDIGNSAGSSEISIVAEQDPASGDMIFRPLQLKNFNDSFYKMSVDTNDRHTDANPVTLAWSFFRNLATNMKAKFVAIDEDNNLTVVVNGTNRKGALAVIDGDGNVYSSVNAKSIKSLGSGAEFTVNKPINEWLSENPEVGQAIGQLPTLEEKMNFIGKYLISKKSKDEIESEEFIDIFCQAGILGFTDKTCLMVYKLIM